jgi:glycosyltransferase involved in cell wall biosynthesis
MVREYRRQRDRLGILARYKAILTNSTHMVDEYATHGLTVRQIAMPVRALPGSARLSMARTVEPRSIEHVQERTPPWRLLFVGRMDLLKGGRVFLDALPRVVDALKRPVSVVFAGDGPDRGVWESRARELCADRRDVTVRFVGWRSAHDLAVVLDSSDLLVLPSMWPEPFGQVGLEAGLRGVPVAAFAVGGITDWLIDDVNGCLASGNPPTCDGLTGAIVRCLADPLTHARLGRGALQVGSQFSMKQHLVELLPVLQAATRSAPGGAHDVQSSHTGGTFSHEAANL